MEKGIRNFEFQNPTKIVFGKDQIKRIGDLIPQDAKVLILYGGGSVKKFGTFDRVVEALGNREWAEFSGIEANPTYETLIQAVDKIKAEGYDYLLAVGGGSVIDCAKAIGIVHTNGCDVSAFEGADYVEIPGPPLICI
ncbi:MAG TPA: iron-containing alcohol dehydrogenase, partial [Trichococcus flocculiformis]|nr:iron-containing alcohol dehydrogenase [Trichococcus flocculiformis]